MAHPIFKHRISNTINGLYITYPEAYSVVVYMGGISTMINFSKNEFQDS